jgi:hypothetical protein
VSGPVAPFIRGYLHTASTGAYTVFLIGMD